MRFIKFLFISIYGAVLCSCAAVNEVSMKEAEIHYDAAQRYEAQHDFNSAREQYWKALVAARDGNAAPATISMLTYEFGRLTGYTCHLKESEEFLLEALKMEEGLPIRNSRNIGIRSFELARLMYDQKRYAEAANFFSKGLQEVENNGNINSDPIAFADMYKEYGDALNQSGKSSDGEEALQKANRLLTANPGRKAKFTPVRYKCE